MKRYPPRHKRLNVPRMRLTNRLTSRYPINAGSTLIAVNKGMSSPSWGVCANEQERPEAGYLCTWLWG